MRAIEELRSLLAEPIEMPEPEAIAAVLEDKDHLWVLEGLPSETDRPQ